MAKKAQQGAPSARDLLQILKENTVLEQGGLNSQKRVKAIGFPWFCLRYLFRANGWPLGKMIMVVGPPASYKSAFTIEVARWFGRQKGATFVVDTEGNPYIWAEAALQDVSESLVCQSVQSLEKACEEIINSIKILKKGYDSGVTDPFLLVVDSATGALDERTLEKMDKDGAPRMAVAPQARYWSDFSRKVVAEIVNYPISFLVTNHLNINKDMMTGMVEKHMPGGKQMRFMSFWMIEMKVTGKPTQFANRVETSLGLKIIKSKCGPEEESIEVPWVRYDVVGSRTGNTYTCVLFDWFKADAQLLCDGKGLPTLARDRFLDTVRDVLKVNKVPGGSRGTLYYCNELGISKSDAVPPRELGKALFLNEKVRRDLDSRFGICEFDVCYPIDQEDAYDVFRKRVQEAEGVAGLPETEGIPSEDDRPEEGEASN